MTDATKYEQGKAEGESSPSIANPKPGDVLAGKYRIGRILGEGGMGVVVEATHLQLRQSVAIKFMHPRATLNKDNVTRFEREARAAVRLKSAHVAKVLDTGTLENGAPYMVMEYLEGRSLSSLVRESGGGLPLEEAVDYFLQACEGVAEAHALGVVHRDLKPSNLFLTTGADGSPTVKVLDFGVSKLGGLAASTGDDTAEGDVTKTQAVVGSPLYMSPEQMKSSRDVDHRSDIWSLGVCLFEMVTGTMPFVADSVHQQYTLLMVDAPPKPSDRRPDVPPELDAIVLRCLARERDARFADVGELARALTPFANEHALVAIDRISRTLVADRSGKSGPFPRVPSIPPRGMASTGRGSQPRIGSSAPPPPPTPKTDVTWGGTTAGTTSPRPSRAPYVIAGIATCVALALAGALYIGRTPKTTEPATPSATAPAMTASAAASSGTTASTVAPAVSSAMASATAPPATTAPKATSRPTATAKPTSDTVDLSHRK